MVAHLSAHDAQPNGRKPITYVDADAALKARIALEWGEMQARHMHLDDGFSIIALSEGRPVGLLSVGWRELPPPLSGAVEAFVDIIEVCEGFRRRGVARTMIGMAAWRATEHGACQLRAWSSDDKLEAIPMWQALGFGLCPAATYPRGQEVHGYFAALRV